MSGFAIGKFATLARGDGIDKPQRHYPDSNAAAGSKIIFFDIKRRSNLRRINRLSPLRGSDLEETEE